MLTIILTLFLELSFQQDLKIYCHKDEYYYLGQQLLPISLQNKNKLEIKLEQNQEILQQIANFSISNLNDQRELVFKQFQSNQLRLIFWDQDHYLCKYIVFKLYFENASLINYEEIIKDQITFQLPLCTKFLNMYKIDQQMFIFCEEELFIQLFVLDQIHSTRFNLTISSSSKIDKQKDCHFQLQQYQYIYLAFLNCQDWIIYVVKNNNFEIFIYSKQLKDKVLKSLSIQEEVILQFEYEIYIGSQYEERWFYSNQQQQILFFFSQDQQYVIFLKGENKMELEQFGLNNILLITNQQTPKQVLKIDDSLIINYGTYIEVLERIDAKFILNISIDYLINELPNYPLIYAFYENQIILLRKNILNPTISCNELMKYNYIFYTTNYLFKSNVLFKSEIISEEFQNQNCQLFYIQVYLRNTTFQLKIYKQQSTESCIFPNILNVNQSNLRCQIKQLQQQYNCENFYNSNIRWQKLKYNKELYILFQKNSNQKLYLQNCNNNLLMELGRFENFEEKNIYEFKNLYLLIFQQQTKVLIIYCESNYFNQTIIEFKEQIIDIFYQNYVTYLNSNSCTSYIIVNKQYKLFQNNEYLQIDGVCTQMKFFNGYLTYIHDGSIIMMKNNITNIMKFADGSVVKIFKIYTYQFTYIIHLKNQDGDHLSKYIFINNQFIKLYDLPKLNFQFASPLNYKITKYLLIVAAYTSSGINVLLVYYFSNNYSNSLIDIIQVDNFNFYMSDEDLLIYNFNQEIKMINIKFDKYICEVNLFPEFIKNITFPLILTSKFNISQDYFLTLNLQVYNLIKNLSHKESITIPSLLEIQEPMFPLDPRLYINGPIDYIVANDLIIFDPIQKQGQISKLQCQKLINQICINYNDQHIIFNPFSQQEIITLALGINQEIKNIIKYQDFIFILYEGKFTIQVYNTLKQDQYFFQIPQLCIGFIQMQIYLNFYILLCSKIIYFYKIHDYSLEPFSQLQTECMDCQIMEITNANFTLSYILSNNKVSEISLITIYDDIHHDYSNRTQIQIFEFVKENSVIFIVQNITFLNSSYYEILVLKQQIEGFLYYFEAFLDKRESAIILKKDYALIRHFQYTENLKNIHFLGNDIILIIVNDSPNNNTIYIYNVSEAFNLKYIDYIFNFQIEKSQKILLYDDQHFIIDSYIQNDYCQYNIQPYRLMLKGQKQDNIIIEFINSVSSLQMQIRKKTSIYFDINYNFVSIVIVFTILICFFLKFFSRNKHISLNISKEIEL